MTPLGRSRLEPVHLRPGRPGPLTSHELQALTTVLHRGEEIEGFVRGRDAEHESLLWVMTPRRLIVVGRERLHFTTQAVPHAGVRAVRVVHDARGHASLHCLAFGVPQTLARVERQAAHAFAVLLHSHLRTLRLIG